MDTWARNYVGSLFADPGVLAHELERSRPVIAESSRDEVAELRKALATIESEQATLAGHLTRLTGSAAEPLFTKLNELATKRDTLMASLAEAERNAALAEQVANTERSYWADVLAFADWVGEWGYAQKREALSRLGVRVLVQKHGSGQGTLTIEVAPPWPKGVEWRLWEEAEAMRPTEFELSPDGIVASRVTTISKSVYAAYKRTQSLANEGETERDG